MGTNKVKYRKIKWAAGIIFIVIAGLIAGCGIYVSDYYPADTQALAAVQSDENVSVSYAADGIADSYPEIEQWYMAGHSLGGSMAASYVGAHAEIFDGLILLASYSTQDLGTSDLRILSLFGSNDQVLNMEKYQEYKSNIPQVIEYVIEGGNHAYFGAYGEQEGDGGATIDNETQISMTADMIAEFVLE